MTKPQVDLRHVAWTALGLFLTGSVAQAQFSQTGPFTGSHQEGFETQDTSSGPFPPCVVDRSFSDNADLCSSSAAAHITGGWGFGCSIQEHGGSRLFGCTGGDTVFTFDTAATRFGGYMGTNNPSASHGSIDFFDDSGTLLYSDTIVAPNDCTWTWNGWDFGGALVKEIRLRSNYSSGGYMMLDDLEADILPGQVGTILCSCDIAGVSAPCGNQGQQDRGCGNSKHSEGGMLFAVGFPSVTNNSVVLHATDVVGTLEGVFFQGDLNLNNGMGVALGDGVRCAGGNLQRLEVAFSGADDKVDSTVDLTSANGITTLPGDTRLYQLWYRDTAAAPCSAQYNLTNAIEIQWLP